MSYQNKQECFFFVFVIYNLVGTVFCPAAHGQVRGNRLCFFFIRHALIIINTLKQMLKQNSKNLRVTVSEIRTKKQRP